MNAVTPFHFPGLVWDWPIAIYLFLIGISAGMVTLAILLKPRLAPEEVCDNGVFKCTAIVAPLAIILGLLILIVHLTRPWTFWKLMFHYNFSSVMSLGVMLFQVYTTALLLWLALLYTPLLNRWFERLLPALWRYPARLLLWLNGYIAALEKVLLLLSVLLGVYTGFLLSALETYPLLNNPVLPVLFLFSGLSSAAAVALLGAIGIFKESPQTAAIHFIHRLEWPVLLMEVLLLCALFIGLAFGGEAKQAALNTALAGGFWSSLFWFGICGAGILLPTVLRLWWGEVKSQRPMAIITMSTLTLTGVLLLRFFILYAGQMTSV
ncbi:MAG: cytochrome c nitrite reductase subunit NrfD [Enterobacteriaceae bacterium]